MAKADGACDAVGRARVSAASGRPTIVMNLIKSMAFVYHERPMMIKLSIIVVEIPARRTPTVGSRG